MDSNVETFLQLSRGVRRQPWRNIRADLAESDPDLLEVVEASFTDPAASLPQVRLALVSLGYDIGNQGIRNWRDDVVGK